MIVRVESSMAPYRANATSQPAVVVSAGVLHGPQESRPLGSYHKCKTPRWWVRWRTNVRPGSLWRCSCGKVYRWTYLISGVDKKVLCLWWDQYNNDRGGQEQLLKDWIAAGGTL
jgi:hypothetical protein